MDATPYDLPMKPYVWAQGTQTRRRGLLVHADGGWGEVAPPPHEDRDWEALAAEAKRVTKHIDPLADGALRGLDRLVSDNRLRAGLATAILDVRARHQGVPMADLLAQMSGLRARRMVAANALIGAVGPDDAAEAARAASAAGYETIKIKCDGDDVARVAAVREAAPDATLRLDANGAWSLAEAPARLDALLEVAEFAYVEDPIDGPSDDWRTLRQETKVPLAADAPIIGPTDLQDFHGAAHHVIIKPQRVGGPDHAAHLLAFAQHMGYGVTVTNSLETAIGRAAACHVASLTDSAAGVATGAWLLEDVAALPDAPQMEIHGPGLGVSCG